MVSVLLWTSAGAVAWIILWLTWFMIRGLGSSPGELRKRAEIVLADWNASITANIGSEDVLRRPTIMARYLNGVLVRPVLRRSSVRHRAWTTLICLSGWWGAYDLTQLAWDCIAWSIFGPGEASKLRLTSGSDEL